MRILKSIMPRRTLNLYNSLDNIKILMFWDILKTKNITLLDKDYKENKTYSTKQEQQIESVWLKLYDEYFVMRNDSKSKRDLSEGFEELKLKDTIISIKDCYNLLVILIKNADVLEESEILKREYEIYKTIKIIYPQAKIKLFDGVEPNLNYLKRLLNSLENKYNLNYKKQEKLIKKEINNVYLVVSSIESWLERSLPIDRVVVSQWLAYEKQVKDKQKAQKNGK